MTQHRSDICALIEPEQRVAMWEGGSTQLVSLVMSDDPPALPEALPRSVCALSAAQARELAFELLSLAEHADRLEFKG